jgi:hypothetical protein
MALALSACRKQGAGWTVDSLVPLAKSTITIQDLFRVEDSVIHSKSDDLLYLVYSNQILDFKLEDFTVPDTLFRTRHSNPGATIIWDKRFPLISDTNTNRLDIKDADLLEARIKEGKIKVKVTSVISEDTEITFSMPGVTKNGTPLSVVRILKGSAGLGNPSIVTETIDLSGYSINLRGKNSNEYNTTYSSFKVEFVDKKNPDTVYTYKVTDYVSIEHELQGITPDFAKGVFHTQTQTADSTSTDTLEVFENVLGGKIDLADAKVKMRFTNYIGADFQAKLNELTSINTENNSQSTLTGEIIGKTLNVSRAGTIPSNTQPPVIPGRYSIEVNGQNSNIDELLEVFPNSFKYNVEFTINPDGNISGGNDFLYADYGIKANMDIEVPLDFMADSLVFLDSSEVNPETVEDLDNVFGGQFRVVCENWFPFDATIRIVFLNAANEPVLEVFEPNSTIQAAIPGEDGIVTRPIKSTIYAPYSNDKLLAYYNAVSALYYITFNTSGQTHKKVYSHYNCGVKMVADLQYNMNIK